MEATMTPPASYPVSLEIDRPDTQSRLTNFPLFGWLIRAILLIPHYVVLAFLGMVASLVYFIATFAILFTGRYPQGMFNFSVGVVRWSLAVNAYQLHLIDSYPAFTMNPQANVRFDVGYPAGLSRFLNLPFFGLYIKLFLLIPNLVVWYFLSLIAYLLTFFAPFAILFTGSYPAGMHSFVVGYVRWSARIQAYTLAFTDKYPPFGMN